MKNKSVEVDAAVNHEMSSASYYEEKQPSPTTDLSDLKSLTQTLREKLERLSLRFTQTQKEINGASYAPTSSMNRSVTVNAQRSYNVNDYSSTRREDAAKGFKTVPLNLEKLHSQSLAVFSSSKNGNHEVVNSVCGILSKYQFNQINVLQYGSEQSVNVINDSLTKCEVNVLNVDAEMDLPTTMELANIDPDVFIIFKSDFENDFISSINEFCLERGKTLVCISYDSSRNESLIKLVVPGRSACLECDEPSIGLSEHIVRSEFDAATISVLGGIVTKAIIRMMASEDENDSKFALEMVTFNHETNTIGTIYKDQNPSCLSEGCRAKQNEITNTENLEGTPSLSLDTDMLYNKRIAALSSQAIGETGFESNKKVTIVDALSHIATAGDDDIDKVIEREIQKEEVNDDPINNNLDGEAVEDAQIFETHGVDEGVSFGAGEEDDNNDFFADNFEPNHNGYNFDNVGTDVLANNKPTGLDNFEDAGSLNLSDQDDAEQETSNVVNEDSIKNLVRNDNNVYNNFEDEGSLNLSDNEDDFEQGSFNAGQQLGTPEQYNENYDQTPEESAGVEDENILNMSSIGGQLPDESGDPKIDKGTVNDFFNTNTNADEQNQLQDYDYEGDYGNPGNSDEYNAEGVYQEYPTNSDGVVPDGGHTNEEAFYEGYQQQYYQGQEDHLNGQEYQQESEYAYTEGNYYDQSQGEFQYGEEYGDQNQNYDQTQPTDSQLYQEQNNGEYEEQKPASGYDYDEATEGQMNQGFHHPHTNNFTTIDL